MPRTCTVCRHTAKAAIDGALVSGTPRREVARRYGLSATAVRRHAGAHLPASLARAAEAGQVADSARLLDRVRRIVADLESMAAECRGAGEREAYLRTSRELLRAFDLLGRVTGEIQTGTSVSVTVGIWQRLGVRDEKEARQAIEMHQRVSHLDDAGAAQLSADFLRQRGWTCLPPGTEIGNGQRPAPGPG